MITNALVIAACAEGLPDSKGCVMKLPVLFVPNRATLAQWEFVYSMDIMCINVECNFGAIECTCQCGVHFIVYHAFVQACTYHYIMICGRARCGVVYTLLKI